MSTTTLASAFSDKTLAFCLLLPSFLLYPDIPLWSFAASLIFWFYRIILDRSGWKIPSRWITGFFSIVFLGITYFSFKTLIGRDASCAFLVVLLSLKILEYQDPKENGFLILLGFYLITSKFLFDTDFVWFSIGFPLMILLIYFLLPPGFRRKDAKRASLFILKSLLLALPLGLFLFFYFPRFSSQSFSLKNKNNLVQGVGFAEDIEPGSVSSLVQNDELVLRAEFRGIKPLVNSLYWRGVTLTLQKGLNWQRDLQLETFAALNPFSAIEGESVQITLEPHYKEWLFTLDQTTDIRSDQIPIYRAPLGAYRTEGLVDKRVAYSIRVHPILTRPRQLYEKKIKINEPPSPEVKKLLHLLSQKVKKPEDVIGNWSEYLIKQQFIYTLEPGDQGTLTLSDFLFKTKKGFCEHYASTTAILLNYLNIPARVVVGYHGGEYNPVGHFWTLRQRDAHAWIEFVDSQNQWRRFDPTAVIAPMRLALGARDFEQLQKGKLEFLENFNQQVVSNPLFQRTQFFFENLNYKWNFLFVNFDIEKQKELLQQMDISLGTAIFFGLFSTLIISLSLSWLLRTRQKLPRSQRILRLINHGMEKYDLEKRPAEGPLDWKLRITQALPEKAKEINVLIDCYIAEAYEEKKSRNNLVRAKQILNSL